MLADPWLLLAAVAGIALFAGFLHSAIGFGYGIVALAILPFVIDARSAHVLISVSGVPVLMMAAWAFREGIEWSSLRVAMLGAALFLPLGLVAFGAVSLDALVRGTGLAILAMTLMSLRNRTLRADEPTPKGACFTAGAVSGFLAGAVSVAGPPVAAFALKQGWPPARFKAFVTQCLLVISLYKVAGLGVGGYLAGDALFHAAWAAPFAVAGIQLGAKASRRIAPEKFQRLVAAALILVSVSLMWRGAPRDDTMNQRSEPREPAARVAREHATNGGS